MLFQDLSQNGLFALTEYLSKLQSVEARCKILEKQLHRMSKMVDNGNKERKAVIEQQVFQASQKKVTAFATLFKIRVIIYEVIVDI